MNYDNEILTDYADKKTRFLNYALDNLIFWILFIVHGLLLEEGVNDIIGDSRLMTLIYFSLLYFLYHFILELLFSKTFGKMLTGTKVVDEFEQKPGFDKILIRNICRLIPFDAISFLFLENGWHDSISKTNVVNS